MNDDVNELSDHLADRLAASAHRAARRANPSASIAYSDEEHDPLADRLEDLPAPNERLQRTISSIG